MRSIGVACPHRSGCDERRLGRGGRRFDERSLRDLQAQFDARSPARSQGVVAERDLRGLDVLRQRRFGQRLQFRDKVCLFLGGVQAASGGRSDLFSCPSLVLSENHLSLVLERVGPPSSAASRRTARRAVRSGATRTSCDPASARSSLRSMPAAMWPPAAAVIRKLVTSMRGMPTMARPGKLAPRTTLEPRCTVRRSGSSRSSRCCREPSQRPTRRPAIRCIRPNAGLRCRRFRWRSRRSGRRIPPRRNLSDAGGEGRSRDAGRPADARTEPEARRGAPAGGRGGLPAVRTAGVASASRSRRSR